MIRKSRRITPRQLDTLLDYLPQFERMGQAGEVIEVVDGQAQVYDYTAELHRFQRAVIDGGMLLTFDWQNWSVSSSAEVMARGSLPVLMKELTRCINREQRRRGSLRAAAESGYLAVILHRLQQIRATMREEDVAVISY